MLKAIKTVLYKEYKDTIWREGLHITNISGKDFIVDVITEKVITDVYDFMETGKLKIQF